MAKILIVDDDELLLGIYAGSFRNEGFEVLTARDGQEAWDMLSGGNVPDVVFTGIIMPGMTGFELVGKIKSDPKLKNIVTVISSHRGRDEDRVLAKNMGVADFIIQGTTTPVEAIRRIRSLLGVQSNFKIAVSANQFDGSAFLNLLNKELGVVLPPTENQMILELERGDDGRFKIKLSE